MSFTKSNGVICIRGRKSNEELCAVLRGLQENSRIHFENPEDLTALERWMKPRIFPGFSDHLPPLKACTVASCIYTLTLGSTDVDELKTFSAMCPNVVELDCDDFQSGPGYMNRHAIEALNPLFPRLRRLVLRHAVSKAAAVLLHAFRHRLVSFEYYSMVGYVNDDPFDHTASVARISFCIRRCPRLRHVCLPFGDGIARALVTGDLNVFDPPMTEGHMVTASGRQRLSFVQTLNDSVHSDPKCTTCFIRPTERLIDWKNAMCLYGIAFRRANAGHRFVDSGLTTAGGIIQQIGAFLGGDEAEDMIEEFGLERDETIVKHSAEVKAEQKDYYPRVQKFVFETHFGRRCVAESSTHPVPVLSILPPPVPKQTKTMTNPKKRQLL
jgi:hypothetical protein